MKIGKTVRRVLAFVLICTLSSQTFGIIGQAAEKTSWYLYYNPSAPAGEWMTKWSNSLKTSSTLSKFSITSIPSGVNVKLYVPNAKVYGNKSSKVFSGNVSSHPIIVSKGTVYTYIVSYDKNINKLNRVQGNIVH